jgi:uncharacterized protein YegP (UPF0339 family)
MTRESGSNQLAARSRRKLAGPHLRMLGGPHREAERMPGLFEVYREDEVRSTSTGFCGGDWHWRLSNAEGLILLDTGGYPSERTCRQAIAILQETAAFAAVSRAD